VVIVISSINLVNAPTLTMQEASVSVASDDIYRENPPTLFHQGATGLAKDPASDLDLAPLTAALTKLAEDIAEKMVQDTLPALIKPQVEESLKTMLPGLVERAVTEEKVLITETAQEAIRRALPDLLKPIADQLAKEIIEKVAREIVPDRAEAAVKKEIDRLTAEV
jgi:hypothetical protein